MAEHLARRIAHGGPLTVAEYMAEALGHPRHGYYAAGPRPIGAGGDFVTAPEISQMFGELIGLWCAELWLRADRPDPITLVEFGPGRGTLLGDFFRATAAVSGFHAALRLRLVETSRALRNDQQWAISKWRSRPASAAWYDRWADLAEDDEAGGPLFVIANEFFDAMPVRQFLRMPDGWRERLVDWRDNAFRFAVGPPIGPERALLSDAARARGVPEGGVVELAPSSLVLATDIARQLRERGGIGLVIDYGYDRASFRPTLQASMGHRGVDPLANPGRADLTAHVDFEVLARAFAEGGCCCWGPVGQGDWLRRLGIEARAGNLKKAATPAQAKTIANDCARLIAPHGMGALFRVLAATSPGFPAPVGFDERP